MWGQEPMAEVRTFAVGYSAMVDPASMLARGGAASPRPFASENPCLADPSKTPVQWHYVGEGRGKFDRVLNYSFVGHGCGSWDRDVVEMPQGYKVRPACVALLLTSVLVATVWLARRGEAKPPATHGAVVALSAFDCVGREAALGSLSHRKWCCVSQKKLCASLDRSDDEPPAMLRAPLLQGPVTGALRGLDRMEPQVVSAGPEVAALPPATSAPPGGWHVWEDRPLGNGTATLATSDGAATAPPPPSSLEERAANAADARAVAKSGHHFDCRAGERNWQAAWSSAKKVWCCSHVGTGCVEEHEPALADCLLWGDLHIRGFDGNRADPLKIGEAWLAKSDRVLVQAKYRATPFSHGLPATSVVAIGGLFLKGHIVEIGALKTGRIAWDGKTILTEFPSAFDAAGLGQITYGGLGPAREAPRVVHLELPDGFRMQVMRWSYHINLRLSMPPSPGGVDGHCGNFDGDVSNDDHGDIQARIGAPIDDELLFTS